MLSKIKAYMAMFWLISTTVLFVVPLMYIFQKNNRTIRRCWAKCQKYLVGYTIEKKGEIDPDANLLLINHQSALDIVALEEFHPKDICWIAKKEIGEYPIFGLIMTIPKMIAVDRSDKRSLIKMLKDVKDRLANDRVIAIFPEGTRGDGSKILKFKNGAKLISEKFNLKVQPVVIAKSAKVLDSKNMTSVKDNITITFLPTVSPEDGEDWYERTKENMEKTLNDELSNNLSHR